MHVAARCPREQTGAPRPGRTGRPRPRGGHADRRGKFGLSRRSRHHQGTQPRPRVRPPPSPSRRPVPPCRKAPTAVTGRSLDGYLRHDQRQVVGVRAEYNVLVSLHGGILPEARPETQIHAPMRMTLSPAPRILRRLVCWSLLLASSLRRGPDSGMPAPAITLPKWSPRNSLLGLPGNRARGHTKGDDRDMALLSPAALYRLEQYAGGFAGTPRTPRRLHSRAPITQNFLG